MILDNVATGITISLAFVFGFAGGAKALGSDGLGDYELATGEILLALWLLTGIAPVLAALLALLVMMAYVVHAFRPNTGECSCFGRRLPTTTVQAQRYRNALLLTTASVLLVLRLSSTEGVGDEPVISTTAGLVFAAAIVFGPWLIQWVRPTASSHGQM